MSRSIGIDQGTQTLIGNLVHCGTQTDGERPPLLRTEGEHQRLDTLKRELTLVVRRVTSQTIGSTEEAVREMHIGLKRTADYLTHVRHMIPHYITDVLPPGSRSAAKMDLRQQVNNILVPVCNNLDHLKAAARHTLLLDVTLLDGNIKRLDQMKGIRLIESRF